MEKNNKYSGELKLKAVKLKLEGIPTKEIMSKLGIRSSTQIRNWVLKYKTSGKNALFEDNTGKASGVGQGRPKTNFNSLEEKVKHLEKENEWLKKSIEKKLGIKFD